MNEYLKVFEFNRKDAKAHAKSAEPHKYVPLLTKEGLGVV